MLLPLASFDTRAFPSPPDGHRDESSTDVILLTDEGAESRQTKGNAWGAVAVVQVLDRQHEFYIRFGSEESSLHSKVLMVWLLRPH